jgi:hypothetical protein
MQNNLYILVYRMLKIKNTMDMGAKKVNATPNRKSGAGR